MFCLSRLRYLFLIVFAVCLSMRPQFSAAEEGRQSSINKIKSDDLLCDRAYIPQFDLPLLTKKEREARISFILADKNISLQDNGEAASREECDGIYDSLLQKRVQVLEPTFVAHGDDDRIYQRGTLYQGQLLYDRDAGILKEVLQKTFPHCPYLDVDREYAYAPPEFDDGGGTFSQSRGYGFARNNFIRSPAFLQKSPDEKELLSVRNFYEVTVNKEYYDFSPYFEVPVWGYFGEGAVSNRIQTLQPKGSDIEKRMLPACDTSAAVIQKVFRADSCSVAKDTLRAYPRMGNRVQWPNYRPEANLNFYAFFKIDQNVYRLNVSAAPNMGEISAMLNSGFMMAVDKITLDESAMPTIKDACTFSNYPRSLK